MAVCTRLERLFRVLAPIHHAIQTAHIEKREKGLWFQLLSGIRRDHDLGIERNPPLGLCAAMSDPRMGPYKANEQP